MLQEFLMNELLTDAKVGKKIQSSNNVSSKGEFALDATEKNPNIEGSIASEIKEIKEENASLRASVQNIIALPNGASTGDGQIEDAKVGIDGETYTTLGDSIRGQIKANKEIAVSNNQPTGKEKIWVNTNSSEDAARSVQIPEINDDTISLVDTWSSNKINSEITTNVDHLKEDLDNLKFYRINVFNKDDTDNILIDKYFVVDTNGSVVGENIFTSLYRNGKGYLITPVIEVKSGDVIRSNGNFYQGSGVYADETGTIIGRIANNTASSLHVDLKNGWTIPSNVKYIRLIVAYNTIGFDNTINSLMITINNTVPSEYVSYDTLYNDNLIIDAKQVKNIPTQSTIENQWSGKVMATLGSSLSQMGIWDEIVKNYFGFSKCYNRGVGSTTLANFNKYGISYKSTVYKNDNESAWTEENSSVFSNSAKTGYSQINAYYCGSDRINTLPINADLILIDLATNDAFNAIQNSDKVDWETFMSQQTLPNYWENITLDTSNFEGAFYNLIKTVQTRCPNARIVVWGMLVNNLFTTNNGYLDKYYEMYQRIEKICRLNGIVFVDTLMYEGANWFNFKTEYHTDSVHPATTDVAIHGVANAIIGALKNVYPKNYVIN